jgi:hypothetical protein
MKIEMNLLQRQRILIFRGGENKEPKSTSIFTPSENYHAYLENNFHPYILPKGVCRRIPTTEKKEIGQNTAIGRRGRAWSVPQISGIDLRTSNPRLYCRYSLYLRAKTNSGNRASALPAPFGKCWKV